MHHYVRTELQRLWEKTVNATSDKPSDGISAWRSSYRLIMLQAVESWLTFCRYGDIIVLSTLTKAPYR